MNLSRKHEVRTYSLSALETRAADGAPARVVGHAAVFNTEAVIAGSFREVILPGAFAESIARDDVRLLFNHDANHVLGRNRARTLRLEEDAVGLRIEADLPDTQLGRDLAESIGRGDITQMSFAYEILDSASERWEYPKDALPLRTISKLMLWDVSAVTYPAFETTEISIRTASGAKSPGNKGVFAYRHLLALGGK